MRHALIACLLAFLGASPARADEPPIVLKLSQFLGPASFFAVDWAQPWARELEQRTGGRVRVELYDGTSALGDVTKQAAQVRAGMVDIALGLRGAEADRFPRSAIIELPFTISDAQSGSAALWSSFKDGMFGPEYQDFKVLALFVHNPGLIHTASKPVRVPGDLAGVRLRAPNKAVAATLTSVGAVPMILQVPDVMAAVQGGRLDGIVTNWGNPLVGFNDLMRFHTNVPFYTSVFFVVMNKERFASLPTDIQAAIDAQSNEALVTRFGLLWNEWDKLVRQGARAPGHTIIEPDAAGLASWRAALAPVSDRYLDDLQANGFTDAHAAYAKLRATLAR